MLFSWAYRPPNLAPGGFMTTSSPQTSEQLYPEVTGLMPPPAESATGSKVSRPGLSAPQPPDTHSFLSLAAPHGHSGEIGYPHSCSYQIQQVHSWQWQTNVINYQFILMCTRCSDPLISSLKLSYKEYSSISSVGLLVIINSRTISKNTEGIGADKKMN